MRRHFWIWLTILALLAAMPAMAGKEGKNLQAKKDQVTKMKMKGEYKCEMSAQECLDKMTAKFKNSGWVGIEYDPDGDKEKGTQFWTIIKVIPESPAEAGGLLAGDVIYGMYGYEFSKANDEKIKKAHGEWRPGQEVSYLVKREGVDQEITITLASWPADYVAQRIGKHMMEHARVAEDLADANP